MDKNLIHLFNLYEGGILSRVLISQIVGIFISLYIFPNIEPFIGLSGLSLFSSVAGIEQSEGFYRIMMTYVNPEGVEA